MNSGLQDEKVWEIDLLSANHLPILSLSRPFSIATGRWFFNSFAFLCVCLCEFRLNWMTCQFCALFSAVFFLGSAQLFLGAFSPSASCPSGGEVWSRFSALVLAFAFAFLHAKN
jgi:hypothetical protein